MSVLVISPGRDPNTWAEELKNHHSGMEIYIYPEAHNKEEVEYAVSWKHPRGLFKNYPNLKVIASMGAGADHITSDPDIENHIIVTRIVDDQLTVDMGAFVLALIMEHLRNLSFHHTSKEWKPRNYKRIKETRVGIMGMGVLGGGVAKRLLANGFRISGWTKTPQKHENIDIYSGPDNLEKFLKDLSILVCLLPLTAETENILNKGLFEKLPQGAYVINVARGQHLVEKDLLDMVNSGHLSGASIDVFRKEPLPEDHPFWDHEEIKITPHIASVTDPRNVVPQIVANYERMKKGEELENVVPREKGY